MGVKKIRPIINFYLRELKKKIKVQKVILFGSFANGSANSESDLDLVIVSPDFTGFSSDKRFSILYKARLHPATRKIAMDIFGFTPKEFDSASPLTTLGEAKETGVVMFSHG